MWFVASHDGHLMIAHVPHDNLIVAGGSCGLIKGLRLFADDTLALVGNVGDEPSSLPEASSGRAGLPARVRMAGTEELVAAVVGHKRHLRIQGQNSTIPSKKFTRIFNWGCDVSDRRKDRSIFRRSFVLVVIIIAKRPHIFVELLGIVFFFPRTDSHFGNAIKV